MTGRMTGDELAAEFEAALRANPGVGLRFWACCPGGRVEWDAERATCVECGRNSAPHRLQLSRKAGYRKPQGAVVVSRPSRWGNVYKIREAPLNHPDPHAWAVAAFAEWLSFVRDSPGATSPAGAHLIGGATPTS